MAVRRRRGYVPPVSADDDSPSAATPERPRSIPLTAAATMAFAFFGVERAEQQLKLARVDRLPPAHDLSGALLHATWRTAQDHRRLTIAADVGTLLVSVLLFVAGSRVLFRPRGGGWLWRQALLGSALVAAVTAGVDHALRAGRASALHAVLSNPATRVPLERGWTVDRAVDITGAVQVGLSWVVLALLGAALVYASRPRVRAYLDA
ncbi:MAG: hypothetical protein JWM10_837 [Myxococcaceae bacterium]|nr:hypothetical protein [Myxococcaceae bacterium]